MVITDARRSSLDGVTDWVLWADKTITFGHQRSPIRGARCGGSPTRTPTTPGSTSLGAHTPSPSSTDCSSTAPHRCHGLRCRTFQPQTSTQATHSNSTARAQPRTDTHPTPGGVNPLSPVGTPGVGVSRGPIPPSRNARWVLGDTVPRRAALGWGELDATSDFRYLEHAADRSSRHPIGASRRCWCRSQPGGNPTATLGGASGGSARSTAATNSPLTRPRSPGRRNRPGANRDLQLWPTPPRQPTMNVPPRPRQ
jgi:hypothetical protein